MRLWGTVMVFLVICGNAAAEPVVITREEVVESLRPVFMGKAQALSEEARDGLVASCKIGELAAEIVPNSLAVSSEAAKNEILSLLTTSIKFNDLELSRAKIRNTLILCVIHCRTADRYDLSAENIAAVVGSATSGLSRYEAQTMTALDGVVDRSRVKEMFDSARVSVAKHAASVISYTCKTPIAEDEARELDAQFQEWLTQETANITETLEAIDGEEMRKARIDRLLRHIRMKATSIINEATCHDEVRRLKADDVFPGYGENMQRVARRTAQLHLQEDMAAKRARDLHVARVTYLDDAEAHADAVMDEHARNLSESPHPNPTTGQAAGGGDARPSPASVATDSTSVQSAVGDRRDSGFSYWWLVLPGCVAASVMLWRLRNRWQATT